VIDDQSSPSNEMLFASIAQPDIVSLAVGLVDPLKALEVNSTERLTGMQQRMVGWRPLKRGDHSILDGAYLLSPTIIQHLRKAPPTDRFGSYDRLIRELELDGEL